MVGGKGLQSCELLEWHDTSSGSRQATWVQLPSLKVERGFAASTSWRPDDVTSCDTPRPEQLIVMGGQDSYWSVHKDGECLQIAPHGTSEEDGEDEQVGGWESVEWLHPLPEARKWTAMVTASLAW